MRDGTYLLLLRENDERWILHDARLNVQDGGKLVPSAPSSFVIWLDVTLNALEIVLSVQNPPEMHASVSLDRDATGQPLFVPTLVDAMGTF